MCQQAKWSIDVHSEAKTIDVAENEMFAFSLPENMKQSMYLFRKNSPLPDTLPVW